MLKKTKSSGEQGRMEKSSGKNTKTSSLRVIYFLIVGLWIDIFGEPVMRGVGSRGGIEWELGVAEGF